MKSYRRKEKPCKRRTTKFLITFSREYFCNVNSLIVLKRSIMYSTLSMYAIRNSILLGLRHLHPSFKDVSHQTPPRLSSHFPIVLFEIFKNPQELWHNFWTSPICYQVLMFLCFMILLCFNRTNLFLWLGFYHTNHMEMEICIHPSTKK